MSRTEGETRDERDVLIGVVTARVGPQWQALVDRSMRGPGPWMDWMVAYSGISGAGAYWLLSQPRPVTVRHFRQLHGAQVVVVDVARCLRTHVEAVAAGVVATETSWPLHDDGPDAWLA